MAMSVPEAIAKLVSLFELFTSLRDVPRLAVTDLVVGEEEQYRTLLFELSASLHESAEMCYALALRDGEMLDKARSRPKRWYYRRHTSKGLELLGYDTQDEVYRAAYSDLMTHAAEFVSITDQGIVPGPGNARVMTDRRAPLRWADAQKSRGHHV